MFAYAPQLADKFNGQLLLAPCVHIKYMTSPFLTMFSREANVSRLALEGGTLTNQHG